MRNDPLAGQAYLTLTHFVKRELKSRRAYFLIIETHIWLELLLRPVRLSGNLYLSLLRYTRMCNVLIN